MDCHSMADRMTRLFTTYISRYQSNSKNQAIGKKGRRKPLTPTLSSLGIVTSLLLALMPMSGTLSTVALAQDQTSTDTASSAQLEQGATGQETIDIQEEIATISSASGAGVRLKPNASSDIVRLLKQGEEFSIIGRSYDEDAGTEWVAIKTEADETLWVNALSIDSYRIDSPKEVLSTMAAAIAPTADILNTDEEIVYIDNVGRIKVLDLVQTGDQLVTWQSPETAFTDIALGDFNNDGDQEIVGIRGIGAAGELVIYDPVLNSTTIQADNAGTAEIPWAELYRQAIGFTPTLVGTGELDEGIPGDEILFGYSTGSTTSEIVVIKGNSLTPDGAGWLKHIPGDTRSGVAFPYLWETVSIGNLNNSGTDEVVFTSSKFAPKSYLQIYRVDNGGLNSGVSAVDANSSKLSWRGTTIANVRDNTTPELISYRKATGNSVGSATAFISRFTGSALEEEENDAIVYNPQPYYAFTADVNAAGTGVRHEELFFIREVTGNAGGIRLIALGRGTDIIDEARSEQSLDADNRWKVGVGADVDGNGIDEVVLMQANGFRFLRYEASGDAHLKLYRNDEALPTNAATIRAGNLDAIGYQSGASVDFEIIGLESGIPAGEASSAFLVNLSTTSATDVSYQIQPTSQPSWITGFSPRSGVISSQNGANLTVTVNSQGLAPGVYPFSALLTTVGADIINSPLTIPMEITILPSLLEVNPGSLSFVYNGCVPPHDLEPKALTLTVDGTIGVRYNAVITDIPTVTAARRSLTGNALTGKLDESGLLQLSDGWGNASSIQTAHRGSLSASSVNSAAPDDSDWLTVTPDFGTVEASITVTITPSALPTTTTTAEALLIIVGDPSAGNTPDNMEFVPIQFLCASSDVYVPLITRQSVAR